MNHGLRRLTQIPLSRRLICEVHEVLMREVRGGEPHKTPGEFRRSQNWIGGGSPATARFVPPPPHLIDDAFSDLERFLHSPEPMPPIVKAALAHAQFETIHPFLDGNGRIGRLLITFWFMDRGILRQPLLYPSLYFKEHRDDYVARLQAIRDEGAWEDWIAFFVDGIGQAAREATERAMEILDLRERDRSRIATSLGRRTANGLRALDLLFSQPVVTAKLVEQRLGVSQPAASGLVSDLAGAGILHEMTGKKRNRLFGYREYLDLFPGAGLRT
jgi:Fic family protein